MTEVWTSVYTDDMPGVRISEGNCTQGIFVVQGNYLFDLYLEYLFI